MASQNRPENPASTLEALSVFAQRDQLEPPETYRAALDAVREVLSQQGGLLHLPDLPTIVIPDLHARRAMLIALISAQLEEGPYAGRQVFELLQQGLINVVCVGDIVHSEERSHWVINTDGEWTAELLDKEMVRSLGAAAMVMYLKMQYPDHFHCLRGSHDDLAGELEAGFRKYVGLKYNDQGEMVFVDDRPVLTADKGEVEIVRDWVLSREGWGPSFVDAWGQFDRALPLLAQGVYYVISHTLPHVPLSAEEIRDPHRPREVTKELTWRRGATRVAIEGTLEQLGIKDTVQRWFHGHTPVPQEQHGGKYAESLDGLLLRLNNQKQYVFAYVPASTDERRFDPTRDVYIKSPAEDTFHR